MPPADSTGSRGTTEGRVVRADAKVFHVDVGGRTLRSAPRGKLFEELGARKNPVAVGDLVRLDASTDPASIEEVLPRRNYLGKLASLHDPREQVLVCNVDQLLVVGSLRKPGFSSNRTDRILAACAWHGIPAEVVLNKLDLARAGEVDEVRATYAKAGIPVLATSATKGIGIEELRALLTGKVSVLYGASGAGKSSLLNAIQPELGLKVGKISKYWDSGRHTTTFSELHPLDAGGYVIDTPGIRVFRLHALSRAELRGLFSEFGRFAAECRYPDCSHDHEPHCAVLAAVEAGEVPPTRYASYLEMLDELGPTPDEQAPADPDEPPDEP